MTGFSIVFTIFALVLGPFGWLGLLDALSHLNNTAYLSKRWDKQEKILRAQGLQPLRTPEWDQAAIQQERVKLISSVGLLVLTVVFVGVAVYDSFFA